MTLTGTNSPGPSEPDNNCSEGVLNISQAPGMDPHIQKHFSVVSRIQTLLFGWNNGLLLSFLHATKEFETSQDEVSEGLIFSPVLSSKE